MISEQLVDGAECRVLNMVELKMEAIDIRIAVGKGSYAVIVLRRRSNIEAWSENHRTVLTFGSIPNS